ncbi:MAG: hypothetical protein Q9162_002862 [Coniocarpon cinnabarinum]
MVVYALLIISKAGGLIYSRNFASSQLNSMNTNSLLNLAGTFHGIHAISRTLNPLPNPPRPPGSFPLPNGTGIESLQTSRFLMSCYQTPTGVKFILFTEPNMDREKARGVLGKCYELYAEFVMRNPFYSLEMPIRCDKFERAIGGWVGVR